MAELSRVLSCFDKLMLRPRLSMTGIHPFALSPSSIQPFVLSLSKGAPPVSHSVPPASKISLAPLVGKGIG